MGLNIFLQQNNYDIENSKDPEILICDAICEAVSIFTYVKNGLQESSWDLQGPKRKGIVQPSEATDSISTSLKSK